MHTKKNDLAEIEVLTDRSSFLDIQSNGKKWVSRSLILCVKDNDLGVKRVGFTVSKRVDKSAVNRNRMKRRLRAVAADTLSRYARDSADYVIMGRKETAGCAYNTMLSDLKWCLKRTGYYSNSN